MARRRRDRTVFAVAAALVLFTGYLAWDSVEVLLRPPTYQQTGWPPVITGSAHHAVLAWCLFGAFSVARLVPNGGLTEPAVRIGRLLYTWALGLALLHIAVAFHAGHGWSHDRAYRHTEEVGGFGPGLYVNYAFAAIWLADVAWAWINLDQYLNRSRWLSWFILLFMAFIVFNAAVVFGHGTARIASAGLFLIPLTALIISRPWRAEMHKPGRGPGSSVNSTPPAGHSPT